MRTFVWVFVLVVTCCGPARVGASARDEVAAPLRAPAVAPDEDWPCFLQQQGPQFTAALERDLDTSRQRLLEKVVGDVSADPETCPAAARAIAEFRREVSALFDATISKPRVLDRLRPRWAQRWDSAQCADVAVVAKPSPADTAASSLQDLLDRWSRAAETNPALHDTRLAQRMRDTLVDMKTELAAVQRDANAALVRALPPIVERHRQAALKATDACIAEEETRLRTDPEIGVSIDPPAPFRVSRGSPGQAVLLKITSSTGKPAAANADGSLCGVGFKASTEHAGVSQDDLNRQITQPQWQEPVLAILGLHMEVTPGQPVERLGIRGMEFIGTPRAPEPATKVRIYLAIFDTPKGRTTFTCATPAEVFSDALPQLRAIRDTLRPPR